MHFIKSLLAVLAISMSPSANATPAPNQRLLLGYNETDMTGNNSTIKPRQGGVLDPHKYCVWTPWPLVTSWEVSYPNDYKYNPDGCGVGLLDNVRGFAMCSPTMFKCNHLDDDGQVFIKFNTFFACKASWVKEAIRASTRNEVQVDCWPA